jgi:hypothetical protein
VYKPVTTPQSIGGVLDNGFRLYRASLRKVVVLAYLGGLVAQFPAMFVPLDPTALGGPMPPLFYVVWLVTMVISLIVAVAVIATLSAVMHGRELPIAEAVRVGGRKVLPFLVSSVLYAFAVTFGLLLLVVPGVLFGVSLAFCMVAVVVDDAGPLASFRQSHRLVRGNWWRTLVLLSVVLAVLLVFYVLLGFVAAMAVLFGAGGQSIVVRVLDLILTPALGALVTPLFYAMYLAIYEDLKLRRSGADLEQRLSAPATA